MAVLKARVKSKKFFNEGVFVPPGSVVDVTQHTLDRNPDALELIGSIEDPAIQEKMRRDLEGKKTAAEQAEADAKAKAEADAGKKK
jgi:hypothetical protein